MVFRDIASSLSALIEAYESLGNTVSSSVIHMSHCSYIGFLSVSAHMLLWHLGYVILLVFYVFV